MFVADPKVQCHVPRSFDIILKEERVVPLVGIERRFVDGLDKHQRSTIQKIGEISKRPGAFGIATEPREQLVSTDIHTELQRVTIRDNRGDILKLIKLLNPALRKRAHSANRKEVVDVDCWALRVVFRKTQPAPNVRKPRFVEEPIRENPCIADRVILPQNGLSCREARPELSVARDVGLIALIKMIPVTNVVSISQAVIDTSDAVPEVGWTGDGDPNRAGLDQEVVDRRVLQILIIGHTWIKIGQEFERIERSLPCSGRFTGSQRYGWEG